MRKLIWSKTFVRTLRRALRRQLEISHQVEEVLRILLKDPFTPQLKTHRLKGKLRDSWACSVGYDLRLIFDFVKQEEGKEDDIFLIEIGRHEEVY
ncbi:MAG TPA: type II toxin-antitoxin system mRNA interferase toxin, RelE/StbE family [Candidatus Fraserbacteria bacterium]|nr:type II toxin-antitoxin system mRNA interferase toxin, RelE/StbE family [Candidatus Fraserbacteria bacterium]